jgi:hypothetical protein|tara:strand:- start:1313 stop:1483 length:171 start_codon:yes stop_codon:yes gene_type:complete
MENDTDDKHGTPNTPHEREIRELNRKIYGLYQKVEILMKENHELSKLQQHKHQSES